MMIAVIAPVRALLSAVHNFLSFSSSPLLTIFDYFFSFGFD